VDPSTQKKLDLWEKLVGTDRIVAAHNGAPRLWSHGLCQITEQKAAQLVGAWAKTHDMQDRTEQAIAQRDIARDAVESLRLVCKTFMVDAYREVTKLAMKQILLIYHCRALSKGFTIYARPENR
jgi:hypothetical protein